MKILNLFKRIVPKIGKNNTSYREKWLEEILSKVPENSRILDAGAGSQQYKKYCSHLNYTSQDFGEYKGTGDGKALQSGGLDYGKLNIVSDITSIPEDDASFDAIMCVEVLEHLPDPILAIKEFSRLLKPGGQLILTAPFCSLTHLSPYHFSTGFNKYWYEKHLADNGYENIVTAQNGNYFEYLAQELFRIPSISSRYSNCKPNLLEYFGIFVLLKMFFRFSKKDTGSSDVLCFGYNVQAFKR